MNTGKGSFALSAIANETSQTNITALTFVCEMELFVLNSTGEMSLFYNELKT